MNIIRKFVGLGLTILTLCSLTSCGGIEKKLQSNFEDEGYTVIQQDFKDEGDIKIAKEIKLDYYLLISKVDQSLGFPQGVVWVFSVSSAEDHVKKILENEDDYSKEGYAAIKAIDPKLGAAQYNGNCVLISIHPNMVSIFQKA